MSKALINRTNIPHFDRDEFLTPFDKMFDAMVESQFPDVVKQVGVKPYQGSAYPKAVSYTHLTLPTILLV